MNKAHGTKPNAPRVSRLCMCIRQSHNFFIRATLLNLTFLHLSTDSCRATFTQSLVSSTSSVRQAFLSQPAKENIKTEDKAEEGETSAVTGRVLSHGANIAQSLRGAATRNAWDRSRLIIKTLHCNKPQFILSSMEACQFIIMRSTVIISKFHQGEPDIIEIIFSSLHENFFCKVLTGY